MAGGRSTPPAPGPVDLLAAQELQKRKANQSERVRAAAENWQKALAALVTLVTTIFVIKGPSAVDGLSSTSRAIVAAVTLLALVMAVGALLFAHRAAYGLPRMREVPHDATEVLTWDRREANAASRALRAAVYGFCGSVMLLALSTGILWMAPVADGPTVRVELLDGEAACGTLVSGDAEKLVLEVGDRTLVFPIATTASISVQQGCDA